MTLWQPLIRLIRPHFLLGVALFYALGAGMAHYLGYPIHIGRYIAGQAWVSLLQLGAHLLNDYFETSPSTENQSQARFSSENEAPRGLRLTRPLVLWLALACLGGVAAFTFPLLEAIAQTPVLTILLLAAVLSACLYATPPVRLASSGYGELIVSVLVASLTPTFAFLLQSAAMHRLLALVTFPLVFIHLAMMLALGLPNYATDLKTAKGTLMIRLGWERGMILHNILLPGAFVLLALSLVSGLPLSIAGPTFLALPLAGFQIFQMNRIAAGSKPNWPVLIFTAVATLGTAVYLFTFGFWTH